MISYKSLGHLWEGERVMLVSRDGIRLVDRTPDCVASVEDDESEIPHRRQSAEHDAIILPSRCVASCRVTPLASVEFLTSSECERVKNSRFHLARIATM